MNAATPNFQILSSQKMSGKVGELAPSHKKEIQPSAPSSPSPPASSTRVAHTPSQEGVQAMQKCQDIVNRMRAEAEKRSRGKLFKKVLVGSSGTWFIWHIQEVSDAEEQQRRG